MRRHWTILLTLALIFASLEPMPSLAQAEKRYFPETGHWVTGDFLVLYESVPDPLQVYGFPITEAFQSESVPQNPVLLVQYFEKARFEYHPENPPGFDVTISPLGEYTLEINGQGKEVRVNTLLAGCETIPVDGFPVCYDFLTFFKDYGGVDQFGYPITGIQYQGGRLVQYFQRARFEWHPELPSGSKITLTKLGRQYFDLYESPILLLLNLQEYQPNLLSLHVHAFLNKPIAFADDTLNLSVIVQDQNLHPVENAQVSVEVRFSDGAENLYLMDLTDEHGITRLSFTFTDASYGMAELVVTVSSSLLQTQTRTSFRVW